MTAAEITRAVAGRHIVRCKNMYLDGEFYVSGYIAALRRVRLLEYKSHDILAASVIIHELARDTEYNVKPHEAEVICTDPAGISARVVCGCGGYKFSEPGGGDEYGEDTRGEIDKSGLISLLHRESVTYNRRKYKPDGYMLRRGAEGGLIHLIRLRHMNINKIEFARLEDIKI